MIQQDGSLKISVFGGDFFIDNEDISRIVRFNWRIMQIGNTKYVKAFSYSNGRPKDTHYLHRLIMNLKKGEKNIVVDHIDGNGLNNRKQNLRITTRGLNASRKVNSKIDKIIGVRYAHGLYYVHTTHEGIKYFIGKFSDEVIAGMAYDKANVMLKGEMAYLNYPDLVNEHHNLNLRDFVGASKIAEIKKASCGAGK